MKDDLSWQKHKICSVNELSMFYSQIKQEIEAGRRFCQPCPVIEECFQYAIQHHEEGVWGGTDEKQRRRLFRRSLVLGVPVVSLQRSKPHELLRPERAYSSFHERISFPQNHKPAVLERHFASLRVEFHAVSQAS